MYLQQDFLCVLERNLLVQGKELDVGPPGQQDEEQASRRQGQQDRQKASEPVEYVPSYRLKEDAGFTLVLDRVTTHRHEKYVHSVMQLTQALFLSILKKTQTKKTPSFSKTQSFFAKKTPQILSKTQSTGTVY